MKIIRFEELHSADLVVDAVYQGGRRGHAGDDPLPKLLRVDSQGGFRKRGSVAGKLHELVLVSSFIDPDWPDGLDPETGVFTYYGDNKRPGRELHNTGRQGNQILQRIFSDARDGERRHLVPPIFLFGSAGSWRDLRFLGLAIPGASDLSRSEELVAIWRTAEGSRFQNYRARFTVLDAPVISRAWVDSIVAGIPELALAPQAWREWHNTGRRLPLLTTRSLKYRSRAEQLTVEPADEAIINSVREHFKGRPHDFEHCAAAIARLMIPEITSLDVTRPSRDGGRDAIGKMRIGTGYSSIQVDFALEAKCYSPPNAVGVRDISRLISRLRHRQFGVLVTTSCVDLQAYKEIKEDDHPIIIISAADIVRLLKENGFGSLLSVKHWLEEGFPVAE